MFNLPTEVLSLANCTTAVLPTSLACFHSSIQCYEVQTNHTPTRTLLTNFGHRIRNMPSITETQRYSVIAIFCCYQNMLELRPRSDLAFILHFIIITPGTTNLATSVSPTAYTPEYSRREAGLPYINRAIFICLISTEVYSDQPEIKTSRHSARIREPPADFKLAFFSYSNIKRHRLAIKVSAAI